MSVFDGQDQFADIDRAEVIAEVSQWIDPEERVIDGEILRKRLNRRLGLQLNKTLFLSLLQHSAADFGYEWSVYGDLVSRSPGLKTSIPDMIRNLHSQGYDDVDDLMVQLDQFILSEPERIQRAISLARYQNMKREQILSEKEMDRNWEQEQSAAALPQVNRLLTKFPGGHNILILTKCASVEEAGFYIAQTVEQGWSRDVLALQLKSRLYDRAGNADHVKRSR